MSQSTRNQAHQSIPVDIRQSTTSSSAVFSITADQSRQDIAKNEVITNSSLHTPLQSIDHQDLIPPAPDNPATPGNDEDVDMEDENVISNYNFQMDGDQDPVVEVDSNSDVDSAWGDDAASTYSESIKSNMMNYTYENGRRYHAYQSGSYLLPNDEAEQYRLDLKHHVFKLILGGKLFCAPIDPNPQRILDIGTGTGLWAIECAEACPSAEVVGTDLSPIQPVWVPPNCSFFVDDAEDDWVFPRHQQFDLIHWRVLASSISDWAKLFGQAYTFIRPGGWLETQEHEVHIESDDGSDVHASNLQQFFGLINKASVKNGKLMDEVAGNQKKWMMDTGFVDVHDQIFKVPIGKWPKDKRLKEIGTYYQAQCLEAMESISMALFTRVLGYTYEEVLGMLEGPRKDIQNPNVHVYMKFHFVYGRKPRLGEI